MGNSIKEIIKNTKIFWCDKCEVPLIKGNLKDNENITCQCGNDLKYLSSDIRPVFLQERIILQNITGDNRFLKSSVWSSSGLRYYIAGKPFKFSIDDFKDIFQDTSKIKKIMEDLKTIKDEGKVQEDLEKFIHYNKDRLKDIDYKALEYIKQTVADHPKSLPVVSFSGGKDSTVVSHLVKRALSKPEILHLLGDTTLEYDFTYQYVRRFREENPKTPFLISRSEHNFMELCKKMGPPSRVMSWCCTVFKTGPLNEKIKGFAKNKELLTFYGIRGGESQNRSNYQDVTFNEFDKIIYSNVKRSPKISKQKVTSPIFYWIDADVWLYILSNKIDFNDAYRFGFTRVGCWCCPNNTDWSMLLAKLLFPKISKEWKDFLIDFAKKIGKEDVEVYVDQGKWKARQGGAGLENKQIAVEVKPCIDEEFSRQFVLTKPVTDELYEYFKPFGIISKELGRKLLDEVYILDKKTNKPIIKIQGKKGSYNLKVTAINPTNYRLLSQRIDCQIRKYQSCIGCLGCVSICPNAAILYTKGLYKIIDSKCTSCMKCISPWSGGCLMTKVLAVKKGG